MVEDKCSYIKVATIFNKGKIFPVWFEWNSCKFPIDKVLYRWEERKGRGQIFYFSVLSSGEHYNISFDSENFTWKIIREG